MLILTLRTDKPEAEIGLYDDAEKRSYKTWEAHRQLAETIHLKIKELLNDQKLELQALQGIVIFKGPGSFTGLRIGLSVANAFADSLQIPIVSEMGDDWAKNGITELQAGKNETIAMPEYGALPNITQQKK